MKKNRSNTEWKMSLSQPSTTTLCWLERARITDDAAGRLIVEMQDNFAKDPAHFPPLFRNVRQMRNHLCGFKGANNIPGVPDIPDPYLEVVWRVCKRYVAWVDRHPHCIREREQIRAAKYDRVDDLVRAWHSCSDAERNAFVAEINPQIEAKAERAAVRAERDREIERVANEKLLAQYDDLDRVLAMPAGPERDRALEALDEFAF
jgi:AcrR family transcriptional regulator